MNFSLETVIYIYLFVAVSIIFFNVNCIFIRNANDKHNIKTSKEYSKLIKEHLKDSKVNDKHADFLRKKLKRTNHLISFHSAIMELFKEDEKNTHKYLVIYKEVFTYLAQVYRNRPNIYRAYFAYLMSKYSICDKDDSNYITDTMLEFMKDTSLYVRENAMNALLSFSNADNVIKALKTIELYEYEYNKKVLTDDLLKFTGKHEELIAQLIANLNSFNEEMQVAIINYVSYKSGEYKEFFYELLIDNNTSKELKLAIIRYFGKYEYKPALDVMYKMLDDDGSNNTEYAAISAFALKNYKSKESQKRLEKALSHPNWYVRKNSAATLVSFNLSENEIHRILSKDDKYATEIMIYELERQKNRG